MGFIENVNTLANNGAVLDSLYADKETLDSLYADKETLDSLYADKETLDTIHTNLNAINSVYENIEDIQNVEDQVKAAEEAKWEAEAHKLTANSYANEAEDVPVKIYTSNGDGTFTITDSTVYSANHWRQKAQAATGDALVIGNNLSDLEDISASQANLNVADKSITDSNTEKINILMSKGELYNGLSLGDYVLEDNRNAVLVNPVTFNSITIGDNSTLKLI